MMTSSGDIYLPDISEILAGKTLVTSWDDVFSGLLRHQDDLYADPFSSFLACDSSKNLLSQNIARFRTTSSQSKSSLEARTAAINVSSHIDTLQEIKSDALWLTQETNTNELDSLRITVLEWQRRPQAELREGYSATELASLNNVFGNESDGQYPSLPSWFSDVDAKEQRRVNIFSTYLRERTCLLGTSSLLLQRAIAKLEGLSDRSEHGTAGDGPEHYTSRLGDETLVAACIDEILHELDDGAPTLSWMASQALQEQVRQDASTARFRRMLILMEIVMLHIRYAASLPSTKTVLAWITLMRKCEFFSATNDPYFTQPALLEECQISAGVVTSAALDPVTSLRYVLDPHNRDTTHPTPDSLPYFLNSDAAKEIHEALFQAAMAAITQALPAIFAWGIILSGLREIGQISKEERDARHVQRAVDMSGSRDPQTGRRSSGSSIGSIQQSVFEDVLDNLTQHFDEPPIELMIESATADDRVFSLISDLAASNTCRQSLIATCKLAALQDLVKVALTFGDYSAEILVPQLAILSQAQRGVEWVIRPSKLSPATRFLNDKVLMRDIFEVSAARFPLEPSAFLQLCQVLIAADTKIEYDGSIENGPSYITNRLKQMTSYTQEASFNNLSFHTIREEENANLVSLDHDTIFLNQMGQKLVSGSNNAVRSPHWMSRGTEGEVISEEAPVKVRWFHSYSGLALLGSWLELHRSGQLGTAFTTPQPISDIVFDVIRLLSSLLSNTITMNSHKLNDMQKQENARSILQETSSGIAHDDDIITVIFDIFDGELQAFRHNIHPDDASDVLTACAEFILVIMKLLPERVWRTLFRSSLVDPQGSDGALPLIIGSSATHAGAARFFETCTLLYDLMIDDSLSHVNSDVVDVSSARLRNQSTPRGSVASNLMSMQVSSLTRAMLDCLDVTSGFTWQDTALQNRINRNCFKSFRKILFYTYGADDTIDLRQKLTAVLASSAEQIAQAYAIDAVDETLILPPMRHIVKGTSTFLRDSMSRDNEECLLSAISLSISLLRLCDLLGHGSSSLGNQLIHVTPALVRLVTAPHVVATQAMALMHTLLASCGEGQATSLLGCLGTKSSRDFVEVLCSLAKTGPAPEVKSASWRLSTQLVGKNQHWFAMMLMTGSPPHGLRVSGGQTSSSGKNDDLRVAALFLEALDASCLLEDLDGPQAAAMLQFVVTAQEKWIWAQNSLQSHPAFFSTIISYVGRLGLEADSTKRSYQNQIVSLVTRISTVHLYQARSLRDGAASVTKKLIPLISWLARNGVDVSAYNASLHANLRKNFAARYSPSTLDNFKRTALDDASFGQDFFYYTKLASKVLFCDQREKPRNGISSGQSFSDELFRANVNLSLVQSQIVLLHSFKALCVEHSASFVQDRELQKIMCHIIQCCTQANTQDRPPENIFDSLFQTRADFALALIRPLVEVNARGPDFPGLLDYSWECLRFGNATIESALMNDSLAYYRTNLSILLLAMQFHVQKGQRARVGAMDAGPVPPVRSSDAVVLEIASLGIVEGVDMVVRALHDQHQSSKSPTQSNYEAVVGTKDLRLLLNLLQSIFRLPAMTHLISQLSSCLSSSTLIQSCVRLYSWSHVLTPPELDNIPIYAELSLQLLASLSSLPPIAEDLAVEGVLMVVSTSRITQSLRVRPGGVSQFDKQPYFQTLYRIWTFGILPLCLNLLHSVGRAMAAEVAAFLNQFSEQLSRASNAFAMPSGSSVGPITLAMAQEATAIALISHILVSYRVAGASAGVDAWEIPTLLGYDENKKELIEDMEDLLSKQHKHLKMRLVAVSDTERGLQGARHGQLLERKIVAELQAALLCLQGDVESD